MKGKVIFTGKSKSGIDIVIRYLQENDLNALWKSINEISKERSFILYQGEEISLEEEKEYVKDLLEKILDKKLIKLLALTKDGVLIGSADIIMSHLARRHLGEFGIIIAKKYRGDGIGKILMKKTLEEAQKELPDIRTVLLGVFETNDIAASMYGKFGFKEYGRIPEGIMRENSFEDEILMFKKL